MELHSLAGYTKHWEELSKVTQDDWVDDILEKASQACQAGKKPIFFLFSTSVNAGLVAYAKAPEKFGAMVMVGMPADISSRFHRVALKAGELLDRTVPLMRKFFIRKTLRKIEFTQKEDITDHLKKDPTLYDSEKDKFEEALTDWVKGLLRRRSLDFDTAQPGVFGRLKKRFLSWWRKEGGA